MKKQNSKPEEAANLRQKAEEQLKLRRDVAYNISANSTSEPDLLKLIYELEVHQIELEMQNEELLIAKEKAELSEEKYTHLYDFASSGYISLSKKGEILELNFAASQMLGKERSHLIKNRFEFFVSVDTQTTFNFFLSDVFTSKVKLSCEVIVATEGNLPIYVNIDGIVSQNRELCLLTLNDITERIRAKKELQESEARFRNLMENIDTVAVQGYGPEGITQFWNKASEKLYGYTHKEAIGCNLLDLIIPSEMKDGVTNAMHKMAESGEPMPSEELLLKHKDGSPISVISHHAIVKVPGHAQELFCLDVDISDRKQAELIAIKERAISDAIIESTPGTFYMLDENGRYVRWNAYQRDVIVGKPDNMLPDTNALDTIHPEDRDLIASRIENVLKNGDAETVEARVLLHGGPEFKWLLMTGRRIVIEEKPYLLGIGIDITERKKAEQELIKSKEHAEESDRLKSAFLANMSHEIRTPMNGILGFAELLKEPGLTGEQQQEYIRIIGKGGARMLNIINDIVDISKIEANLMHVDIKETDINEKIEFIYIFFRPQVEEKGMQLFFKNTLPTKEATIRTDNEKVYAILTNLVKNAIKYSKEGTIEFGYLKKGETLEFYVTDTGIGIPKDRQSAIFERFIQADITDKMARQGAGLGLSISKAYVEMLGGKIWVESEEGAGSTFYFTLPYNAEPEKETVDHEFAVSDKTDLFGKLKILIAEDDDVSEILLDKTVKMFGKEILKARTGVEAVEACKNNPDIDLVLMDIRMPEMGGHEATRRIREFNSDIVIIAQTAYGLSGDREKAIEAGCNDYIAKPIKKDELLVLIQKYFKK